MPSSKPLAEYARKRDFRQTPEPSGRKPRKDSTGLLRYCVQKHDASRLHYDFRLELDGTLKSWAVPKGPCLDPAVKRLAVQVEDHPLDYADFEGSIPQGHYGAGDVIVWDRGAWTPLDDPREGLEKGHLSFALDGEKLSGRWHLIRTNLRGKQPQWFLVKAKDGEARSLDRFDVLKERPDSVLSERTLLPRHGEAATPAARPARRGKSGGKTPMPEWIAPELASLVEQPPRGEWAYELKLDGYRLMSRIEDGHVRLLTRNGHDWTERLPHLEKALAGLGLQRSWLDGELVVLDEKGRPDFQALQNAFEEGRGENILYVLFDLPYHEGEDLRDVALEERRARLEALLEGRDEDPLRFSATLAEDPRDLLASACKLGLEGVIGKRLGSAYRSRRSNDWIKLKCQLRQEFVIVGYTEPKGSRRHIGALLLGLYSPDEERRLRYAGKVGSGFTAASLKKVRERLEPLAVRSSPLAKVPPARETGSVQWVRPQQLCEVSYAQMTRGGIIRQAVFHGLREDKPAREVTGERPAGPPPLRGARKAGAGASRAATAGVRISHPQRLIDPSIQASKLELAEFHARYADLLLRDLRERPVSLVRGPDGIGGELFFQKHAARLKIPGIVQLDPALDPGHPPLLQIRSAEALVGAVQMGSIEFHTWNASLANLERPDRFVLDLDPDPALPWKRMLEATQLSLTLLDELGLRAFLKTSGGKGMHLLVPLERRHGWDEVKDFAQAISQHLARLMPERFSAVSGPRNRVGKIFVDYLRNSRGASTVAAYSVRAREGLPVSVPVFREELDSLQGANQWNLRSLPQRLDELAGDDPWADYAGTRQRISAAMRRQLGRG
ncbi:DNA ligase D [Pseudomonas aeruginosa]|uniref:DNA ligase D n=5 Tax=Pseudomonas aeruginosa TaxID=287 RepID=UPI00053D7691|nr:DNA ligase D [Pseudomonas aeruginosa]AVN47574.1 DNA ligase D [Pseudomonas aeruginosa]EIU5495264.1 DNA ligase D [Pseudomonas aeruginosa]EKV3023713.1 DNA ligase D [Pseudomonas aeruginosa]EMB0805829.1 DNA ligase D [Pseudomonas aeruginosa]KSF91173.1 ATP-dependent DNA ligase [Pseudomonas aeruginosa]